MSKNLKLMWRKRLWIWSSHSSNYESVFWAVMTCILVRARPRYFLQDSCWFSLNPLTDSDHTPIDSLSVPFWPVWGLVFYTWFTLLASCFLLVCSLTYCTLKMKSACDSKMSVDFYQNTSYCNPEEYIVAYHFFVCKELFMGPWHVFYLIGKLR